MNLPGDPAPPGFPNGECRAVRLSDGQKRAGCITKNANSCPYRLVVETQFLCHHTDYEAIVKWTEEYEE